MYVIYDPEDIVMDRKITRDEADDTGHCHVYYDGDDGSEAITIMDEDVADVMVTAWNEAIDEDVQLQEALTVQIQLNMAAAKDIESIRESLAQAQKDKRNFATLLKGRARKIKVLEGQVKALDALAKDRRVDQLKALTEVSRLEELVKRYTGIMKTHGVKYWVDGGESDAGHDTEPRENYVDRDEKLENHHDQREHYKEE